MASLFEKVGGMRPGAPHRTFILNIRRQKVRKEQKRKRVGKLIMKVIIEGTLMHFVVNSLKFLCEV